MSAFEYVTINLLRAQLVTYADDPIDHHYLPCIT